MDENKEIGIWLRSLRQRQNMDLEQVSLLTGLSAWRLEMFELGLPIPMRDIYRLCQVYEVNSEEVETALSQFFCHGARGK